MTVGANSMSYNFPPELKSLVDHNMSLGAYESEDHLLAAALHVLSDYHETISDIRQGMEEYDSGKAQPLEDAMADIRLRLRSQL
jgi:hypothetical protein